MTAFMKEQNEHWAYFSFLSRPTVGFLGRFLSLQEIWWLEELKLSGETLAFYLTFNTGRVNKKLGKPKPVKVAQVCHLAYVQSQNNFVEPVLCSAFLGMKLR